MEGNSISYSIGIIDTMEGSALDNPPVALVVFEVRHPTTEPFSRVARMALKSALMKDFPLLREATLTTVKSIVGGASDISYEKAPKFMTRDRMASVTFRAEATVFEATRYHGYQWLRRSVESVYRARQGADAIDGIERVGLRYVNEIRVPDVGGQPIEWQSWVDPSLLGPVPLAAERLGLVGSQMQGLVLFSGDPGRAVILRYGPREGYAVESGDLKRPLPTPGAYFLLDIDSAWSAVDEVPEIDVKGLLELCDELHHPARALFDALVTDKLRTEVLANAGSSNTETKSDGRTSRTRGYRR